MTSATNPDPRSALLDPETFRDAGHRIIDRLADYLAEARRGSLAVLPWVPPQERAATWPPIFPATGIGVDGLDALLARVIAEANHLHHPRYVGHQVSAPMPLAALTTLVCALLNNAMAVYEMGPSSAPIERSVIQFFARCIGFPEGADGVLTSGGSAGNLTALLAARQAKAGWDVWTQGGDEHPPLAVLVSSQGHYSIGRSAQILGWGKGGAVAVPVDGRYRLRPEALDRCLKEAESAGRTVIAVAASACSTATGSFDPIHEIAAFCEEHGLWLHVDGAHGASALLSEKYRHLCAGIERADSVVWDAHKMLLIPALVTAVIFRDGRRSHSAFAQEASYLFRGTPTTEGPSDDDFDIGRRTLECSKRMMGVEVYAALSVAGTRFFDAYLTAMFDRARRFGERVAAQPDFELAVPPECNIVCFRYVPQPTTAEQSDASIDTLQSGIRCAIIADGSFYLVETRLAGRAYLRVTVINSETQDADLEALLYRVREAGQAILHAAASSR